MIDWYEDVITNSFQGHSSANVTVRIFVTGEPDGISSDIASSSSTEDISGGKTCAQLDIASGRPCLSQIINDFAQPASGRVAVAACGPTSFTREAGNAVASVQIEILQGRVRCDEMYLQTEMYRW